jgi:hypothetical protein
MRARNAGERAGGSVRVCGSAPAGTVVVVGGGADVVVVEVVVVVVAAGAEEGRSWCWIRKPDAPRRTRIPNRSHVVPARRRTPKG